MTLSEIDDADGGQQIEDSDSSLQNDDMTNGDMNYTIESGKSTKLANKMNTY